MKRDKASKETIIDELTIELLNNDFKSKYLRLLNSLRLLKERKEQLQIAFAEIEDIYNNAPCGYYSLDEKGFFIRINDTALNWMGESRKEITGKRKFSDVLTEESRAKFKEAYPVFMKTGRLQDTEFNFVRKDGSSFPVLVSATAVYDERGNYKMSRSVFVDITTRKLMEQDLFNSRSALQKQNDALIIANENLFFLNREKDRFRDIASHDLQLPLVAVSMLSETLLKKNIDGSSEEKRILEMIHEASLEMKALLANILSASLSESGHLDLFLTEIDINILIDDIVTRYIPIAQKKNIQIQLKNKKNLLLLTDRECCTQIIENLVSNAVKYTPQGKNITITITGNLKEAKVIIADEGPGIRKEDRHLLFQRFQKLSARPTGGELSTGLGLSIVKYLVEQLKGNITVESELGKGSTFTVHLPLNTEL